MSGFGLYPFGQAPFGTGATTLPPVDPDPEPVDPPPTDPLVVYARNPDLSVYGELTTVSELTVVERWNDVGRWQIILDQDTEWPALSSRGAGVQIARGQTTIMSGPVDSVTRTLVDGSPRWIIGGPDDGIVLHRTRAIPSPTLPINAQTTDYDVRTGPAETVLLQYVAANAVTRLGRPVTVAVTGGRGTTVTARARFHSLLDLARSVLALDDDLGIDVRQTGSTVTVQVRQGADLRGLGLFSPQVGTSYSWEYGEQWPTATRVIVGAGGEGVDRVLAYVIDTEQESDWLVVAETFEDRRDLATDLETLADEMQDHARATLADQAGQETYRLSVTETVGLRYGTDYRVGDVVRAYPDLVQIDGRIMEAEMLVTRDGEQVTLTVGGRPSTPGRDIGRRLRGLEAV